MSGHPLVPTPAEKQSSLHRMVKRVMPKLLNPDMTLNLDETFFRMIDELPAGTRILNLGSGQEHGDHRIRHPMVNLDIVRRGCIDVCGDGHFLPFVDQAFDAVFSNAVLEHVRKPWVVAEEIRRVLRVGGLASINVPFLNVIHDLSDYFRFTADGLRVLFEDFEEIKVGVSSGPSSFFPVFFSEYVSQFIPVRDLRAAVRYLFQNVLSPMKYLDRFLRRSDRLAVAADAFYFVGRRTR